MPNPMLSKVLQSAEAIEAIAEMCSESNGAPELKIYFDTGKQLWFATALNRFAYGNTTEGAILNLQKEVNENA
jgi:hypothetical protein